MFSQVVTLLARHALTAGGGYLVSKGLIDTGQAEILIGAGLAITGIAWSVIEKRVRL